MNQLASLVPHFLTIASSAALVLSVVYDWSYMQVVGKKYLSIMTLGDHISSGIEWLPVSIGGYFLGGLFFAPTISEPKGAGRVISFQQAWLFFALGCILWVVNFLFDAHPTYILYVVGFGLMGPILLVKTFWRIRFFHENRSVGFVVTMCIIIVLIAAARGADQASVDLARAGEFEIRTEGNAIYPSVTLLKSMEKGILFRVPELSEVKFEPWPMIRDVTSKMHSESERVSRVCRWWAIRCRSAKTE